MVGSSLQCRAPIAKEGVEGSNPFFRSKQTIRCTVRIWQDQTDRASSL